MDNKSALKVNKDFTEESKNELSSVFAPQSFVFYLNSGPKEKAAEAAAAVRGAGHVSVVRYETKLQLSRIIRLMAAEMMDGRFQENLKQGGSSSFHSNMTTVAAALGVCVCVITLIINRTTSLN